MTKQPPHSENPQPSDERNIVSLDPSYEGASVEDRLFLFWHNYRKIIVAVSVLAILILAGWGLLSLFQERREARIQSEYQQAQSIDELKAFAEQNGSHRLAGAANLEVADYHFENADYAEAARFYQLASEGLDDLSVSGRARIGRGAALALAGEEEAALSHLEDVGGDSSNLSIVRAEAYYHAAGLAVELGQPETARAHAEQVAELDRSRIWAGRAMGLLRSLPKPEAETVEAEE